MMNPNGGRGQDDGCRHLGRLVRVVCAVYVLPFFGLGFPLDRALPQLFWPRVGAGSRLASCTLSASPRLLTQVATTLLLAPELAPRSTCARRVRVSWVLFGFSPPGYASMLCIAFAARRVRIHDIQVKTACIPRARCPSCGCVYGRQVQASLKATPIVPALRDPGL
ncbi:hypothetical protein B0H16DRAFT_985065 [Mycena metata]|uniref:Uncharacterized protein n=1 Tax=Mycena metata TaxID=1033252 RepID=A0AAD7IML4_9AGAR|nr:hypothetical protein B0H16DRAFT_985065 [Mycena metata]